MIRRLVATVACTLACTALSQPFVTLTAQQATSKLWRDRLDFRIDVAGSCLGSGPLAGTTELVLPTLTWNTALTGAACTAGRLGADPTLLTNQESYLWFGTHAVFARASVSTTAGLQSALSPPVLVSVVPDISLPAPTGPIDRAVADSYGQSCKAHAYSRDDAESVPLPRPPTAKRIAYGYASFDVSACGTSTPMEFFLLRTPGGFPGGAELWIHEANVAAPAWRLAIPAQDFPGQVESWALGDARGVHATVAVAYPNRDSFFAEVNGLWWGGPAQDGWGLDVSRVDDRMFATFFIHDASSAPRWAVMAAGRWEGAKLAWVGDLYEPRGAPFAMGAPVGQAILSFEDSVNGHLAYTLHDIQGAKELTRFDAAGASPAEGHTGLWWSPTRAGQGLSVRTVGDAAFVTWYTYDMNGEPTWYYVPGGSWTGALLRGTVYRVTGTPWAGSRGTATSTVAPAGNATLDFSAPGAVGLEMTLGTTTVSLALQRFAF